MLTVWDTILSALDRINILLPKPKLAIDIAVKHLHTLIKIIENLSETKTKAKALMLYS